jgi:membrane-bound lytic murein transglycosylase F
MITSRPGHPSAGSAESRPSRHSARLIVHAVMALALAGCSEQGPPPELGDLDVLRAHGRLRILIPQLDDVDHLPREVDLLDRERHLAESLAQALGLEPEWIVLSARDALIDHLVEGRGDVIAANLTVTDERRERIAFSRPLAMVREQVVLRDNTAPIRSASDLVGRTVVVRRSSSFWGTIEALQVDHPGINLVAAPEDFTTEEILYRVSTGEYDATVADDKVVLDALAYMPRLMVGFSVTEERPVALGVRPEAPLLLAAVDSFLDSVIVEPPQTDYTGDFEEIRRRKVLRVLTRNSAATYFVWRGELIGFEYDLAKEFAAQHGLNLEIVVPPTRAALLAWLREGKGDIVAAALTPSAEREGRGIAFTRPYNFVREMVVGRQADSTLQTPEDLAGRTVVARQSSSYWHTLEALQARGIPLILRAAPEDFETEEIIERVATGEYDLTVADSHILAIELTWRDDVLGLFPVSDSLSHAWAVREEDSALLDSLNVFFRREYRGLFYNLTRKKYFGNENRVASQISERTSRTGIVSPYDSLIQYYADQYAYDWRLIAAQMFEESRFNPQAESFAGAVGLMQVLPRTAKGFGVSRAGLMIPDSATYMGVRYLNHVREYVEGAATAEDHLWFSLAAYNAGYGHLEDARRLTESLGKNPNVWFGEVEEIMPLLARRKYHRETKHGYCRCTEPVRYVRRIRERQRAYQRVTDPIIGQADPGIAGE